MWYLINQFDEKKTKIAYYLIMFPRQINLSLYSIFLKKTLTVSVGEGDPFDPFNLSMACSGGDSRDPVGK